MHDNTSHLKHTHRCIERQPRPVVNLPHRQLTFIDVGPACCRRLLGIPDDYRHGDYEGIAEFFEFGPVENHVCVTMVKSRSLAPVALKRSAMTVPLTSVAAKLILYHPLDTSETEFAAAANAAPSMERVAVTVKPVFGALVVESVIMNIKFASAVFFLMNSVPAARVEVISLAHDFPTITTPDVDEIPETVTRL